MSHKTLKYLRIQFSDEIAEHEIPAFRGAVANTAGHKHILFHNHDASQAFRYAYPLIQYKRIGKKATLICVDQGTEEVYHFFKSKKNTVQISDRALSLSIENLTLNQFKLQVWDASFQYRIINWLALSQENYKEYLKLYTKEDQITFLEKKLIGNILSFAKGVEWTVDKPIELKIEAIEAIHTKRVKQHKVLAFSVAF
ncbi:MAG: hypothetical protein LPJ89_06420, partial [Hymenobacteraceae bacterium]|nr:hypothetical protein [Hymenobacteraceae bacterium]MDX5443405.1 hypothetical protein [Hymenobacteraceae bacterium]MDX5511064.1 hypothetical protein [Hymenobacteraceae bacterium]